MSSGKILRLVLSFAFYFLLVLSKRNSIAQSVDVDLFTGAVNAKIPIYNVRSGDISIPIVLYNNNNGIRVEDVYQFYGLGWNMTGEVSVSRTLKGFPDDVQYTGGSGFSTIYGWLKNSTIRSNVDVFTISNDNNPNTCGDEPSDYNNTSGNMGEQYDTEPDIFSVNLPGGGFDFVFDKNGVIKVSPYRDVKVEYTTDLSGFILTFTVTDENGIKYVFDQVSTIKENIDDNVNPATLPAFKRDYIFFRRAAGYPEVTYNGKWYVSTITDTKGNKVYFTYEPDELGPDPHTNDTKKLIYYNSGSGTYPTQTLYTRSKIYYVKRIKFIQTSSPYSGTIENRDVVQFIWDPVQYDLKVNKIKLLSEGQQVEFNYSQMSFGPATKYFLHFINLTRGISCNEVLAHYEFRYQGLDIMS